MTTDYNVAKDSLKDFPKYYLGQEVQTPLGKGIIIELFMRANGLHVLPNDCGCIVWFGTEEAFSRAGFVQKKFDLSDIDTIN